MPFDRLVCAVDAWAQRNPGVEVFGQIGETDYVPVAMQWAKVLPPDTYLKHVTECQFMIGHAGMGTVITAAEHGKRLLAMPRRGSLRETRNDHQVATAEWLGTRAGIRIASDENAVARELDQMFATDAPLSGSGEASPELIAAVRRFIEGAE
ncbi:MAG: glucuronosyltransferase [Rhodocyclaceae bacterium]|nr:glucuronosyltransferase [Rhodocyclaceae bacterium]